MDFDRSMDVFDARLYHPSTMLIAGPSSSGEFSSKLPGNFIFCIFILPSTLIVGKTSFTLKLLENRNMVFKPHPPSFVILIYESWQKRYDVVQEQNWIISQ